MASYHFELKSDKKPSGVSIKAGSHISYINREGKFQNIDANTELRADVHSYRSTISGTHPILPLPHQPVLLYSSPFGKIKLDAQGIHVTKNASLETVGIALAAAQRIFGEELSLAGTEAFQESALATVRDLNLDLHFMTSSPTPLPAAYQSPTLINLPSTKLPKKDFACMYCPAGMWALKGDALLCFCRMMSSVSYTSEEGDESPVWLCDGLTLAQEGAM